MAENANANPNPLVKIAMTGAGIAASLMAKKALTAVWKSAFHEEVPDKKQVKKADKELKKRQKEAKKNGADKSEVKAMKGRFDDVPTWRIALWTILSGTVMVAIKQLAREGARKGAEKAVSRRPAPNRG